MDKKKYFILLLIITGILYFLGGIVINPLIVWVAGPMFISYPLFVLGRNSNSHRKYFAAYAYLAGYAGFSILYHLLWYTNAGGIKTGSSTSALIFAVFPIYAVIIGFLFGIFGYAAGAHRDKNS